MATKFSGAVFRPGTAVTGRFCTRDVGEDGGCERFGPKNRSPVEEGGPGGEEGVPGQVFPQRSRGGRDQVFHQRGQ